MKNFWRRRVWFRKPAPPDNGELLALLDDQLTQKRRREIIKLLGESWEVRTALNEIERDIETYVSAQTEFSSNNIPSFDDVWRGFSDEHKEINNGVLQQDLELKQSICSAQHSYGYFGRYFGQFFEFIRAHIEIYPRLIAATVCSFIIISVAWFLLASDNLSIVGAEELLAQAQQAEQKKLAITKEPVVYRKLRVQRIIANQSPVVISNLEVWHDARNHQLHQRIEREAVEIQSDLERIRKANHLKALLSPASFAEWRASVKPTNESVKETTLADGAPALTLKVDTDTYNKIDLIISAEITIRTHDRHVISETLSVTGKSGVTTYEMVETNYSVIARHDLDPKIFGDGVTSNGDSVSLTSDKAPLVMPVPITSTKPTMAELASVEVATIYALHQLRVDLDNRLEVISANRGGRDFVEVRGTVENTERKTALSLALKHIPHVQINLVTNISDTQFKDISAIKNDHSFNKGKETGNGINSFSSQMKQYYADKYPIATSHELQSEIEQVTRRAVRLSGELFARASALQKLGKRYSITEISSMDEGSRNLLEIMVRNHIKVMQQLIQQTHALLMPMLVKLSGDDTGIASTWNENEWPNFSSPLFNQVAELYQVTNSLFGNNAATSNVNLLKQLAALIATTKTALTVLGDSTNGRFIR